MPLYLYFTRASIEPIDLTPYSNTPSPGWVITGNISDTTLEVTISAKPCKLPEELVGVDWMNITAAQLKCNGGKHFHFKTYVSYPQLTATNIGLFTSSNVLYETLKIHCFLILAVFRLIMVRFEKFEIWHAEGSDADLCDVTMASQRAR